MSTQPTIPPSGKPPGKWKFHEVLGPTEAREWLEKAIADGYKASISAYKYDDDGK